MELIGERVCELLERQSTVSSAELIAHFGRLVASSLSVRNELVREADLHRLLWEAVIRKLDPLRLR